jgi:uncharacterized protein YciI
MTRAFAVLREQTGPFDHSRPLEEQLEWTAHAAFMDALTDEGFFVLVGPLAGTRTVLQIVNADDADQVTRRLADDPWTKNGMLRTLWIAPWTLRVGALP